VKKKALITFSGLDGSGKSTLAQRCVERIDNARLIHIIEFRLVNKLVKSKPKRSSASSKKKPSGVQKSINYVLLCVDAILFRAYHAVVRKSIVSDRYFYDLVATHAYRYGWSSSLKFVLFLAKKPDVAFFIQVPPEVAANREVDDAHNLDYFKTMQGIYENKLGMHRFKTIENKKLEDAETAVWDMYNEEVRL
jgi:thymidylate kinase